MRFTLARLKAHSRWRPKGYVEDVLSHAKEVAPGVYHLTPEANFQLCRKYRPKPQELWALLHHRALSHQGDDTEWLAEFERRIVGGCNCRQQWREDLVSNPPTFGWYFEWTVRVHNIVNARLGKPLLSTEQARAIWS